MALISFLSRHAAWVLAIGVFAGLLLPTAASLLRPLLPLAVGGLLVLSVMQTDTDGLRRRLTQPVVPLAAVLFMLCALPAATWGLLTLSNVPEHLKTPIVLMAAAPPIMSAPAMALLLRLNATLMLVIVVSATLLAPFTLGVAAEVFVASGLDIDPANLALRLAGFILGCFLLATLLRKAIGVTRIERHKSMLDVIGLIFFLTFAVAVMDGVSVRIEQQTNHVLALLGIAFLANVLLQCTSGAAFYLTGVQNALTIAFASGNRNMGLLLAVLPPGSAPDTLLYLAVAQIPLYTLPAILSPMYNSLLKQRS